MWWNGPGAMFGGWWFMPLFGIIFMVIFFYFIARILGGNGFCARNEPPVNQNGMDELRQEIRDLRAEIKVLRASETDRKQLP